MNCLANIPLVIGIVGAVHHVHAEDFPFNLNSAVKEDENGADTRKHKGF
jgi:hypothetical protein